MTILTGPAASGKTSRILSLVRAHLSDGVRFRLIVPTATVADRIRKRLAHEGFVFNPQRITTLSRFVDEIVPDLPSVTAPQLDAIVRESLVGLNHPIFRAVENYPGFRDRMIALIEEFSASGTDSSSLHYAFRDVPFISDEQAAFLTLYERVEQRLTEKHLWLRGPKLMAAVGKVLGSSEYLIDGFYAFSVPERELIASMSQVTLTLPSDWPEAQDALEYFRNSGANIEELSAPPSNVVIRKVEATTRENEADEIARRIVEAADAGTSFDCICVILRNDRPYGSLLRSTFVRFGIPARFYFSDSLEHQSPIRFLIALIEALLSGWDRTKLLELVQLTASGLDGAGERDRIDFTVRELVPGFGLEGMGPLKEKLSPYEDWRTLQRTPEQWAKALTGLRALVFPRMTISPADAESAVVWRSRAEALKGWEQSLTTAAESLRPKRISLDDFWVEAKNAIRLIPFRIDDRRMNAVHVMDAFEARQHRFPVVFVCGRLEGEFPGGAASDPVFDEGTRLALREAGIPIRLQSERQAIEDALPRLATQRADREATLSWPAFNALGEPALKAFDLDDIDAPVETAIPCRVRPSNSPILAGHPSFVDASVIRHRFPETKKWQPTEIETFLQCPFKYFGNRTLRLQPAPRKPEDRFGPLEHGSLVHTMLKHLAERSIDNLEEAYDFAFREVCRKVHIAETHHLEWHRLEMLRNLRIYLASSKSRPGWTPHLEWPFEFVLIQDLTVRGRIDRFDESPDGQAFAVDYKYSNVDNIKKKLKSEATVQGGLYLLGLKASGYQPHGFAYVPLRGDAEPFEDFDVETLMGQARERTIEAVTRILAGDIAVRPADTRQCKWCDFRDACRIRESAAAFASEAEE